MLQVNSLKEKPLPYLKTVSQKVVSILNQPLFTFTFSLPEKEKPKIPEAIRIIESKKTEVKKRTLSKPVAAPIKPQVKRNNFSERQSKTVVFTPSRNREEFEKINFVLRACEKNTGREYSNVLHIERSNNGSRLITTDGKRMHVAEIRARIKPGDYKPVVTKDFIRLGMPVKNICFPNWQRVVPENTAVCGSINLENIAVRGIKQIHESFEKQTGERVNPEYIKDLTKRLWVIHRQKENRKALLLKQSGSRLDTYAVIMPLMS